MLLDDMRTLLSSAGIGLSSTQTTGPATLYTGEMPETPDTLTAVFETGGLPTVKTIAIATGGDAVERPAIMVLNRAPDYRTARALAQKAFLLLDGLPPRTINGVKYKWAEARHSPFPAGQDLNKRHIVSCNYDLIKEPSTTS